MSTPSNAARAYAASAARRNPREQESEVFRRVNAALRAADGQGAIQGGIQGGGRARALADNDRLWVTVIDLVRDPDNALPAGLRASIASIGLAVRREMKAPSPDIPFLMAINESVAAGLAGRGG